MKPFVSVQNLVKEYHTGNETVLAANGIDFRVGKGEFALVLGPSGSGKSTLLNILGGMDQATAGEVIVDNEDVTTFSPKALNAYRRHDIGFVFQFYNLLPNLTAEENVEISRRMSLNPLPQKQALAMVGLSRRGNHFPVELSGGEQQRVSIARAISKNPKLLLCDEPTGALDSETGKSVLQILWQLCKEAGPTVLVVTHNQAIAGAADRVIHLRDGKVAEVVVNPSPIPMAEVDW